MTQEKICKHLYLDEPVDVFTCKSTRSTCLFKGHNVELRNLIIPFQRRDGQVSKVDVSIVADFSHDCKQYQINDERMRLFKRNWGQPIIFSRGYANKNSFSSISWEEKSNLAHWGYTASKETTASWRQARLSYLIDNSHKTGITTESVVRHLDKLNSMARDMPTETNQDAISRRIADIVFVQEKYVNNKPVIGELIER